MLRCKLILTAENILRDADSDTISVFTIIEELNSPGFPTGVNKMCCLFYLERDEADESRQTGVVTFIHAGNEVGNHPIAIDFQDKFSLRFILRVMGVILPGVGTLLINVKVGETVLGTWSINVKQTQSQHVE